MDKDSISNGSWRGSMKIPCVSERGHTAAFSRVLPILAALLQGAILLHGSELGFAFNGNATGFFGGVDVSGWYSADFNSSSITVRQTLLIPTLSRAHSMAQDTYKSARFLRLHVYF